MPLKWLQVGQTPLMAAPIPYSSSVGWRLATLHPLYHRSFPEPSAFAGTSLVTGLIQPQFRRIRSKLGNSTIRNWIPKLWWTTTGCYRRYDLVRCCLARGSAAVWQKRIARSDYARCDYFAVTTCGNYFVLKTNRTNGPNFPAGFGSIVKWSKSMA